MIIKQKTSKRNGVVTPVSLLVGGLWLASTASPAFATDFTVNNFTDDIDAVPGDGICETASAGICTLRAAIMEANELSGADTIAVPAGTYQLTITGVDELCENPLYYTGSETPTPCSGDGTTTPYTPTITSDASIGDLDITDDVTITGAGSDLTRIEWAASTPDNDPLTGDRIFHVAIAKGATANIASVVIEGLTVVNGEVGLPPTVASDVCIDNGTGTLIYTSANLNAFDIDDNGATDTDCANHTLKIDQFRRMGGAIALGGGYSVVLYEDKVPGADTGGGVDMGPFPGGKPGEESGYIIESVSINDVNVINNWSGADGGGLYSAAPTMLSRSKISGNVSNSNGGGIYNDAVLTISDSLIGKVFDADTATAHPELTSPNVGENGGGMFDTGAHITTIQRSAFNGNEAIGGGGIAGRAGITINITNSTVSGNTGTDVGGGITTNGIINLQNVTVANNVAATDAPGGGGGLNSFGGGHFYMHNSLLANNVVSGRDNPLANCGCSGGAPTCPPNIMVTQGYNLEDGASCDLHQTSDQINTDPLLVALADNGGLTETHLIPHSAISGAVDSPAVDAGDDSNCPNNDQRGSIRPVDGNGDGTKNCDIGAFELFEVTPDLQISNMVAPDTVTTGNKYIVTVTVYNGSVDADSSVMLATDVLPSNVTFVSATATGGSVNTCTAVAGVVTCDLGDLGGTTSATVTLTLIASLAGDAKITASVTSIAEPDASADINNSASVLTRITAAPSGDGGGGGFCSYQPNGRFDPVLPALLLIGLIYLVRKRMVQ